MAGSFWAHVLVAWRGLLGSLFVASGGLLGGSPVALGECWALVGDSWSRLGSLLTLLGLLLGLIWAARGHPGGILDIFLNRSARRPGFLKIVLPCKREHDC